MMLLATIIYFKYLESTKILTFYGFLENNQTNILKIFGYNWLMLLFGYLGETKKISLSLGVPLGFVFFALSFYTMYSEYATTPKAIQLFNFLLVVWSLYGVAAIMDTNLKNLMYNILDIISKNFYGLFIFYKILQIAK